MQSGKCDCERYCLRVMALRRLLNVTLKINALRYLTLCILVKINHHLPGTCCLRLQVGSRDEGSTFLRNACKTTAACMV